MILKFNTNPFPKRKFRLPYKLNCCDSSIVELDRLADCDLRHDAQLIWKGTPWNFIVFFGVSWQCVAGEVVVVFC